MAPIEMCIRDRDSTLYVATKGGLIIIDTETQAYNIYAEAGRFKENNMLTVYKAVSYTHLSFL